MTSTADLYDQHGDDLQSLPLQLRSFGGHPAFEGPIRTVRCFQDNALVKELLATPGDGAVLVIDGDGSLGTALMGDMIAQSAVDNGWAGVVIHGAVRDSVAIGALPLGVKALGTNPRKSGKTGRGEVDVVVEFGGVSFRPGARLYADEDGILVER
ncbi:MULTISPECIES: ribonuclease E activity regulator RraA [Microbacterium]|uniref:ribonuclease E activity regulator RraA n=1 Tax=Microbacterium TaxID=33882 RepID=UPI00217D518D|nr:MULTISPECIES: ribonuclease E activity regulator RraA [Microbacterium]UWF77158.1 ribonuclease E activity regulator RraA [Microbacterium neungamense]WCM55314.1 ribonuclease E activity regulator RraA [Microbacterium sp. EF45047]